MNDRVSVVFVVTYIDVEHINNFIESFNKNNNSINAIIYAVSQSKAIKWNLSSSSTRLVYIELNKVVNSSIARNAAINHLLQNNVNFDFILFPDDDTIYDKCFFVNFPKTVVRNNSYVMPVYCLGTNIFYKEIPYAENDTIKIKAWKYIGTVNLIIDYKTFIQVGCFDEKIGAGAYYGAGEDGDYYIRCVKTNGKFYYTKYIYNYHPSPDKSFSNLTFKSLLNRFRSYGRGVIYMLCKHEFYFEAFIAVNRGLFGAIKALALFKFKLSLCYLISWIERYRIFFLCYVKKIRT